MEQVLYIPGALAMLRDHLEDLGCTPTWCMSHIDKVAYVLHIICTRPHFLRAESGYVDISVRQLRRYMSQRYVDQVLELLVAGGIVERDQQSKWKVKAMGYRIAQQWHSTAVRRHVLSETFAARLAKWRAMEKTEAPRGSLLDHIARNTRRLRIRYAEADAFNTRVQQATNDFLLTNRQVLNRTNITNRAYQQLLIEADAQGARLLSTRELRAALRQERNLNPDTTVLQLLMRACVDTYTSNMKAIDRLHARDFAEVKREDPQSRAYTSLTNLWSELRCYLYHAKHDDQVLVNLDIANSQPFFLNVLLREKFGTKDIPADVQQYIELTSSGQFYEYVAAALGTPLPKPTPDDTTLEAAVKKRARTDFKQKFFSSLFFCEIHHTLGSAAGKYFQQHFPNVYALICERKRGDYKQLAIDMQRAEAGIMLDKIFKKLTHEGIWCTSIHDSVVVLPGDQERVRAIMLQIFEKYCQLTPTINPEPFQK